MKNLLFLLVFLSTPLWAGEGEKEAKDEEKKEVSVSRTFETSRLIHAHTVETLRKKTLDIRIAHRFGDIAGPLGGVDNFFGFDNVSDVRIALEYGITDELTVALGRSKGTGIGPDKLLDGTLKYRFLTQGKGKNGKMPISMAVLANTVYSLAKKVDAPISDKNFRKFAHRLSYDVQLMIARRFNDWLSLQIMPNYLHRNFVEYGDENDLFSLGVGLRVRLSKNVGIIMDYYHVFSDYRKQVRENDALSNFFDPLGIGIEIRTGGHVFQLNFSNAPGILENNYLPYTKKNWLDGQFRFGFNISREIKL